MAADITERARRKGPMIRNPAGEYVVRINRESIALINSLVYYCCARQALCWAMINSQWLRKPLLAH